MATRFPPIREAELVTFTQNFSAKITATPTLYSLTAAQATAYAALSVAFVNSFNVANANATRSPMNITLKNSAKNALIANLRVLARIVQNAPTTTNAMRDDLGLPQRGNTPAPVPAPGTPFKFSVTLGSTGALMIKWKCNNPRGSNGTIYQIYRKIGPTGSLNYIGGTGEKKFTDNTVPAGSSQVMYQIQAVRSTGAGPWAQYTVNFGVGGAVTSAEEAAPAKKAA